MKLVTGGLLNVDEMIGIKKLLCVLLQRLKAFDGGGRKELCFVFNFCGEMSFVIIHELSFSGLALSSKAAFSPVDGVRPEKLVELLAAELNVLALVAFDGRIALERIKPGTEIIFSKVDAK